MSRNQGKDGEMRFNMIASGFSIRKDGIEVTRPTQTNQPDMGADFYLKGRTEDLVDFCEIAKGEKLPDVASTLSGEQITKSRIDVKSTLGKLSTNTIRQFVDDVPKHPHSSLHILIGGKDLSKPARECFEVAKKKLSVEGKALVHLPNADIERLENSLNREMTQSFRDLLEKPDD